MITYSCGVICLDFGLLAVGTLIVLWKKDGDKDERELTCTETQITKKH